MHKMTKYGLIGYPLSHSFSPGYFAKKFKNEGIEGTEYDLYPLEKINEVQPLLDGRLKGINVTIPYKEQVIPFLDELSAEAQEIGAVNTIKITKGKRVGYNTDVYGFRESLRPFLNKDIHKKALILGNGGASLAVKFALKSLEIDFISASTSGRGIAYGQINQSTLADCKIIVNTTPLGMSPKQDTYPKIPYQHLGLNHILFDLVYNPEKTLFLKQGEAYGAAIKNGLEMLHLQAEKSWEIWNE